ncbi:MAG TPA: hypothetical protein VKB49_00585 [Candidatus Sulfotelmatobacter sp.]|nr:hypothetical protein [Candidatus Sulfotelmatobacter sp.]
MATQCEGMHTPLDDYELVYACDADTCRRVTRCGFATVQDDIAYMTST